MSDFNQRLPHVSRRSLMLAAPLLFVRARAAAAPIDPLPAGIEIPDTSAGRELGWIIRQVNAQADGLTARAMRKHFDSAFLAAVPENQLIEILRDYAGTGGPFTVARFEGGVTETRAYALAVNPLGVVWRIRLGVTSDEPHLINELYFEPAGVQSLPANPPTTWTRLEAAMQALAPRVSFAAAELTDSGPRWLSRLHGDNQRAIASLFKIYVLGALSRSIQDGEHDWSDPLAIASDYRSLPNGNFRLIAPGTELTLRTYAEQMIAASDNTATDHLIGLLGREPTQSAFSLLGHSQPDRNDPLLMTREWFAMRIKMRDSQLDRYLDADEAKRLRILANTVDPLADGLTESDPWPGPRYIDRIEWFAGASDLVRALDWHRMRGLEPPGQPALDALSLNPGITWHPGQWSYVGYKGGYETGVMSNAWLLQRQDGRWFAFAGIINDTRAEIDAVGFWPLLAVAERLLVAEP